MTKLITELRKHNSTIDKQRILNSITTEEDKKIFLWAYDPFKRFRVTFSSVDMYNLGMSSPDMFTILEKLSKGALSGKQARNVVETYSCKHGDLIKLICNKDLNCGVSATTLNKVFGKNFIPKFCIQLAKELPIEKITFPVLGQLKYNGARVIAIFEDGVVTLKSRGGHIFSFPELEFAILDNLLVGTRGYIFDGELTFGDSQNEDHTKVSGLINSAIKGTPIKENTDLIFHVFDALPLIEFKDQYCSSKYEYRLGKVNQFVTRMASPLVKTAKNYIIQNKKDLVLLFDELLSDGYEGLILKYSNGMYTYKKNTTWIKMKATETADLLCTGYNEGTGKYEGMIGSLICEGKVEGQQVHVSVGSGLNDSLRSMDPQKFIGKIIEVKYNKVIKDTKKGTYSLFLPRYKIVREDKS